MFCLKRNDEVHFKVKMVENWVGIWETVSAELQSKKGVSLGTWQDSILCASHIVFAS